MLDASDLLSAPRQPAAVSGSLKQQTGKGQGCNIISLMETINDTYTPRAASTQTSTNGLRPTNPRQGGRAPYDKREGPTLISRIELFDGLSRIDVFFWTTTGAGPLRMR
jgi:hypothetical protein